ncbi:MAG: hypothetical protein QF872_08610, partial [Gammaproteobacteria bacterium]|nr:hypothetical protein [Gammaproteobacteria bacterium]
MAVLTAWNKRWCLGLYLGAQGYQAVLLYWHWGRMRVQRCWHCQSVFALDQAAHLSDFLQPIVGYLQSVGRVSELVVNIGLPHDGCAWQPLPAGGPVIWQRQAATYWQLQPSQIYLDTLPVAYKTALLVSTPSAPLEPILACVRSLQEVVDQPLVVGLEADVTSMLKLWPWHWRSRLAMFSWQHQQQGLFVDQAGLHVCQLTDLPPSTEHYLLCRQNIPDGLAAGQVWHWQVPDLHSDMLVAWHLAYMPGPRAQPRIAWYHTTPLTLKQRWSLLTGLKLSSRRAWVDHA